MSLATRIKLAATAAALAAAVCGSWAAPAQAATPSVNAGSWRFCSNCVERGGDLSRFAYVGLNAWFHDRIPAIKAANPSAKALVYKDMASTRSWSCGGLISTGVDYCWASANHPEWFTLDAAGRRIEWTPYPGVWQMDVGTRAYQDQWTANVVAELRANGWDGVVIDNANVDESPYLGGRRMREYPTQASYEAATRSFLAHVCPQVIAAGFLCLPNIQAHSVLANDDLWADWVQFTSGGVREYWTKWGSGTSGRFGGQGWSDLVRVFERVQGAGKIFLPVTSAPRSDRASIRYARASFLLVSDGGPSASIYAPTPEATDPWSEESTVDLGAAAGSRYFAAGVWQRDFESGKVVVNPSTSSRRVPLGGTYELPSGSRVSELDLAPMSGAVLRTAEPDLTSPETAIVWRPIDPAGAPNAVFRFAANEPGSSFVCRLDGAATFSRCSAHKILTGLRLGEHTLEVAAVDQAANVDGSPDVHTWTSPGRASSSVQTGTDGPGGSLVVRAGRRGLLRGRVTSRLLGAEIRDASLRRVRAVTIYRRTRVGWRPVRGVSTGRYGSFHTRVRPQGAGPRVRLLLVARYGDTTISSQTIVVRRWKRR